MSTVNGKSMQPAMPRSLVMAAVAAMTAMSTPPAGRSRNLNHVRTIAEAKKRRRNRMRNKMARVSRRINRRRK